VRPIIPVKRNGFWYLIRRVPRRFAALDTRGIVKISTHIRIADDPSAIRAGPIAAQLNRDLEDDWRKRANGEQPGARKRYDDAVQDARGLGFGYLTTPELSVAAIDEIVRRFEKIIERRSGAVPEEVTAVLGGEDRPVIRVSDLLTEYEEIMKMTSWERVMANSLGPLSPRAYQAPVMCYGGRPRPVTAAIAIGQLDGPRLDPCPRPRRA
jgi:hypothetical protein